MEHMHMHIKLLPIGGENKKPFIQFGKIMYHGKTYYEVINFYGFPEMDKIDFITSYRKQYPHIYTTKLVASDLQKQTSVLRLVLSSDKEFIIKEGTIYTEQQYYEIDRNIPIALKTLKNIIIETLPLLKNRHYETFVKHYEALV
ncbi:MAG: hypothetical protein WC319_13370 [Candidatus Paceibacterota bacterium]|jgi:hypothetical protein